MAQAQTTGYAGMPAQNSPNLERWLTLREGEAYSCTLGPRRELFLLREDDGSWTLWWGQWGEESGKPPLREKTLATRLTFEQALKRGNDYLDWWFGGRERVRIERNQPRGSEAGA